MSRLVISETIGKGQLAAEDVDRLPKDDYKDRLVKYIPAESIALYTFADKFLIGYYGINAAGIATKIPADTILSFFSGLLPVLGLIGTPIYLYRQRRSNQRWGLHASLSTVAFVFWIYTMGGSLFLIHHWYNVVGAAMAAPIFTFVAGMFEPKPESNRSNPPHADQPDRNSKMKRV